MITRLILLSTSLLFGTRLCAQSGAIQGKLPAPWPSNLNVRLGEPGCWKPPGDGFSQKEALETVATPLAAGLDPTYRNFGEVPAYLHIDGFVRVFLPVPPAAGTDIARVPCEASVVHLGPRKEKDGEIIEPVIRTVFLLTSRGKTVWKKELSQTPSGAFAEHYKLARVVTRFDRAPFVLLFSDSGGNTRNFSYDLYRVTLLGLENVWASDFADGHSGSTQQAYAWSNFDFSKLRSGQANEFTAYTTSGIRRVMETGDGKDLKPKHMRRVYRWDASRGMFVKAEER